MNNALTLAGHATRQTNALSLAQAITERRFGTVDFRVFPAQFRAQIDQLCTVLADESKG